MAIRAWTVLFLADLFAGAWRSLAASQIGVRASEKGKASFVNQTSGNG